jgi:hypothetical protein
MQILIKATRSKLSEFRSEPFRGRKQLEFRSVEQKYKQTLQIPFPNHSTDEKTSKKKTGQDTRRQASENYEE